MIFRTEIQGIPCSIVVIHYVPAHLGRTWGPVDLCYPPEPVEIEFHVINRRGERAPGLEAMINDADVRAIEQEIIAAKQAEERLAQEDVAEERHFEEHFQ